MPQERLTFNGIPFPFDVDLKPPEPPVCRHCGSSKCPSLRYSNFLQRTPVCPSLSCCRKPTA